MKKKILITTYSPCIQGSYGIVQRELFKRIHEWAGDRFDIVSHAWFHVDITDPVPWKVIPTNHKEDVNGNSVLDMNDNHGQQSFTRVMNMEKPDIVFALGDHYMLNHLQAAKQNYQTTQFIAYLAVDAEPWHKGLTNNYESLDHVYALSQFGSKVIATLMQKNIPFIYHGVDLDLFNNKFTPEAVDHVRRVGSNGAINGDAFVIGWVGRDQYRKQIWKLWELMHYLVHGDYIQCNNCGKVTLMEFDKMLGCPRAIGLLRMYDADYNYQTCWHCKSDKIVKGTPRNNVFAWSHMSPAQGDGWDPNQLGDIWRVRPQVYTTTGLTPNKGIKTEEMPQVYRMFDLFYCMSGGEGFGIPVLESMASGVPVMYTNYSAHAEVVGETGIPVNCQWTCEMNSCYDRASADTADAVAKILPYINDKTKLQPLKEKAHIRAQNFSWDAAAKKLLGLLDNIAVKIKHGHGKVL